MFKFRVGDEIIVTGGRDKGKKGKIQSVLESENKIVIVGVNIYKRHKKASRTQKAGIYEVTRPISTANVAIICPKCGKTTRVGFQMNGKTKERICKKCKATITTTTERIKK